MIVALRKEYYWPGMKKNVAEYLARCLECQQIKAEHQHLGGLLQPFPIPEWKWETISMDFITGLPKKGKNNNSIMVVVDKLRTQLNFNRAYHPRTDGQTEQVNQVVEDMLRAYVMQQLTKWEEYFHLVEFAYNNSYHTSLQMSPFEVLYGRKCRTPSSWGGPEEKLMLGVEMLKEMEEMAKMVQSNLKSAQDRQMNFVDQKRRFKEYQVGDHVYLALPSHIRVHNVFHVSVLKKYVYDPKHVIRWQDVQVKPEGEILVKPLNILDRREVLLRKRAITQVKVQWQHFGPDEATWEDE
eukprot:PITA_09514